MRKHSADAELDGATSELLRVQLRYEGLTRFCAAVSFHSNVQQGYEIMSYAETLLPEFDEEMANTRKVLERVPEEKLEWRAGPKFNTIGWNANHVAEIPGWVKTTLTELSFEVAPADGEPYRTPTLASRKEILDLFDRNVAEAREAIAAVKEEELDKTWSLLHAGNPVFSLPRSAVMRSFVLNHLIHHRAHLCVYLRLNDVAVPGMYGPGGEG